ncbi:MAG: CpaE family protein [Actinomycetota bacterium]
MNDVRVVAVGAPQTFRQQVARTLEMEPDDVGWMPSVTAVEESLLSGREWADVIVLSPGVKDPDAIGLAEFTIRSSPTTSVVLVRDRSPNGMLPVFMRAGIRDVVDLSRGNLELREALDRAMSWSSNLRVVSLDGQQREKTHHGVVFSVFSSKGGTGKTFLSTNLAAAIADITKQPTAIVDLDLGMGDVFTYYGKEPERPLSDIVALGEKHEREVVMATASQLHDHLWGFGSPQDPAVEEVPGEAMGKALRSIRDTFAYTIVDASANYADHNLATFDLAHTICLISGLDVVGVRHLAKAIDTLTQVGFSRDRFKIVLNFVDPKVGLEPARVERVMKIHIDSLIPASRSVPAALNRGRPAYVEDSKSDVSRRIHALAESLVEGGKTPVEELGGHLSRNGNGFPRRA